MIQAIIGFLDGDYVKGFLTAAALFGLLRALFQFLNNRMKELYMAEHHSGIIGWGFKPRGLTIRVNGKDGAALRAEVRLLHNNTGRTLQSSDFIVPHQIDFGDEAIIYEAVLEQVEGAGRALLLIENGKVSRTGIILRDKEGFLLLLSTDRAPLSVFDAATETQSHPVLYDPLNECRDMAIVFGTFVVSVASAFSLLSSLEAGSYSLPLIPTSLALALPTFTAIVLAATKLWMPDIVRSHGRLIVTVHSR